MLLYPCRNMNTNFSSFELFGNLVKIFDYIICRLIFTKLTFAPFF